MKSKANSSSFLSVSQAASQLGICPQSVRNLIEAGELECVRTLGSHRRIASSAIRAYLGLDEGDGTEGSATPVALVARVSTNKQGKGYSKGEQDSDLSRQIDKLQDWAKTEYPDSTPTLYSRIASGMNFEDPTFVKLINDILDGRFSGGYVVVVHSERLCRFGLDLVKNLIERGGAQLVVLDQQDEQDGEYDSLSDDILAIVSHFGAKYHGRRSAITNTKHVSDECVKRMVELREGNYPVDQITRILNAEGFKQQKANHEPEAVTEHVVLRYLDSNGVEKVLKTALGVKPSKRRPVEEFLAKRVKRSKGSKTFNSEIRKAYVEWCEVKGVKPENHTNMGKAITALGFERGKDCKGNRYYKGLALA